MKKEEIRREFFKLKIKGFSYSQCKKILIGRFSYDVSKRTLKRWVKRLDKEDWNLKDFSRRPNTIYTKITENIESQVILLRNKTGWGCEKLHTYLSNTFAGRENIPILFGKWTSATKKLRENIVLQLLMTAQEIVWGYLS